MRDFAKISCSIWRSKKFRGLPDDKARYLYFYLHTCPHVNSLGCFVLPEGYALADLKWTDEEDFRKGIETLSKAGLIGFQEDESVVRIVDFLKHSPFTNPNHAAGAIALLELVPDGPQKDIVINELSKMKHVRQDALPAISGKSLGSLSKPSRNTETETETETEKNGGGGSAQARDPLPSDPTWREQMLGAMGVDASGLLGPNGKVIGQRIDLETADRWEQELGLPREAILTVIRETMGAKRDGPPASFRYFSRAMQREAARLAEAPLQPAQNDEVNHGRQPARDRREAEAADRLRRKLHAAARID